MENTQHNISHWLMRLNMLGDVIKLSILFNSAELLKEIATFASDWKQYNPRKSIGRMGLSITSYDGKLSGIPDLDSLLEYNIQNGTDYKTEECNILTPVYHNSKILQQIIDPWKSYIGRSHFLKLNSGGFFPEHRDSYDIGEIQTDFTPVIRLIGFVKNCQSSSFKFIINDQLQRFEQGKLYYFNSMLPHSLFSFKDDCIMIVFVVKFDYFLYRYIVSNLDQS